MTSFKLILAILIGKTIAFFMKLSGSGGTAAPGLIALKFCPCLVEKLSRQLDKNIVITGTNGKTTTARMVSSIFKKAGVKHLHNRTGSNLERGIASTLIKSVSFSGRIPKNYWGLWEADEAAFPIICRHLKPQTVLITNLFRDQLDRYGEINTVVKKWQKTLLSLPKNSVVLLNADDATVASLGKKINYATYFGLSDHKLPDRKPDHASDATACPKCFSELIFDICYVGHMGEYRCPVCGPIQPDKKIAVTQSQKGNIQIRIDNSSVGFISKLPGIYNLYNFSAAIALSFALNIPPDVIQSALAEFKPAFGRVEQIKIDSNRNLYIFLVKNPTGFNEVIETILTKKQIAKGITCLIAINDLIADGTDISWLWDVHFEKLAPAIKKAYICGSRALEMALRLKYTNTSGHISKEMSRIKVYPLLDDAIDKLLGNKNKNLYILPTYTAMLQIRKILNKKGLVQSSWKD